MESAKPQKSRIRDHLVSSIDESSKCPNSKKTGRDVIISITDGCYFARVLIEDGRLYLIFNSAKCVLLKFKSRSNNQHTTTYSINNLTVSEKRLIVISESFFQ